MMKISGKRPVLFYQEGSGCKTILGPRIRIFYPNGKAEWGSLSVGSHHCWWFKESPCYLRVVDEYVNKKGIWINRVKYEENIFEAIKSARAFDKNQGFKPMKFLGEL